MPGKTLPVTLKIRNAGSESVSRIGYKVTMQSADQTEKVLVEEEKDVTITAGETVPVVVNVPIPENISSRKLKLQIWEMKDGAVVDEVSDNNNFSEITVGLTDLEVSAKLYTTAAKNSLVVTVKNNSQVPAAEALKFTMPPAQMAYFFRSIRQRFLKQDRNSPYVWNFQMIFLKKVLQSWNLLQKWNLRLQITIQVIIMMK